MHDVPLSRFVSRGKIMKALDAKVGAKIRERRLQMGLSSVQLADKLGISSFQLQKYETGANAVSVVMLVRVASILKNDPSWYMQDLLSREFVPGAD